MEEQEPENSFFDIGITGEPTTTPSQITEAQLQAPPEETRGFELADIGRITNKVWVTNNALMLATRDGFEPDPTYVADLNDLEEYAKSGVPTEYLSILTEAKSKEEERYLFSLAQTQWQETQKISELGGKGTAATLGLAILDPAFIGAGVAATAATGPAGTAAVATAKFNRVKNAMKAAGVATAIEFPLQSVIAANQADVDSMDAFAFSLLGGGFTGGITYAITGKAARLSAMAEHTADIAMVRQGVDNGTIGAEEGLKVIENLQKKLDRLKSNDKGGVFGQAFRFDTSAYLNKSKDETTRGYANLVTEPVGRKDATTVGASSEEYKSIFFNRHMGNFVDTFDKAVMPLLRPLLEGKGKTQEVINKFGRVVDASGEAHKIREHVAKAIRRPAGEYTRNLDVADDVKKAIDDIAEVTRKEFSDMLEEMKAAGVTGLDDIDLRKGLYVPRIYNAEGIRSLMESGATKGDLVALFTKAIRSGTSKQKMTDARVKQIAAGMVDNIIAQGERAYLQSGKLTSNMSDELVDRLKATVEDITDEELEGILAGFVRREGDTADSVVGAANRRVSIDETVSITTDSGKVISFEDMLDNNIQNLLEGYIHRAGGILGMARNGHSPEQILKDIKALEAKGEVKDARVLMGVYNKLMGYSTEGQQAIQITNNTLLTGIRRFTSAAQLTFMNQVALAQLPEFASVLGTQIFKANTKNIPAFRKMLKAAGEGRLDEQTMRILNRFTGIGTSHTRFAPSTARDSAGVLEAGKFGKVDELLNKAVHGMYTANGMHLVTSFQRQMSAAIEIDRLLQLVQKGWDEMTPTELRRLAAQGISKGDWTKYRAVLRSPKYVKTKTGNYGDEFQDIDFEAMYLKNPEMAEKLSIAIKRAVDKAVVTDDIGSLPLFADSAIGRIMLQFRKFTMMSYPKLFMGMLYRKDHMDTAVSLSIGMTIASLVYLGQVHLNAIGKGDKKQDYLDDRLGFDEGFSKFILTAMGRTSQLAAPMSILDMGVSGITGTPLLGSGRYMGLSADSFNPLKTPAGSIAVKGGLGTLQGLYGVVTLDQELVAKSLGDVSSVAPFARLPIVHQMVNGMNNFITPDE